MKNIKTICPICRNNQVNLFEIEFGLNCLMCVNETCNFPFENFNSNVFLFEKNVLLNDSINQILKTYPNLNFYETTYEKVIQWTNSGNNCWLDVILCYLVNSTATTKTFNKLNDDWIGTIIEEYESILNDCKNMANNVSNYPKIVDNVYSEPTNTPNLFFKIGGRSTNNNAICNFLPNIEPNDGMSVITRMDKCRSQFCRRLDSTKFKFNFANNPMLLLLYIYKNNERFKGLINICYTKSVTCNECATERTEKVNGCVLTINNFYSVSLPKATFPSVCNDCGNPKQKNSIFIDSASDVLIVHFRFGTQSLINMQSININNVTYHLKAIILYKEAISHFVIWIHHHDEWILFDDNCSDFIQPVDAFNLANIQSNNVNLIIFEKEIVASVTKKLKNTTLMDNCHYTPNNNIYSINPNNRFSQHTNYSHIQRKLDSIKIMNRIRNNQSVYYIKLADYLDRSIG
ncbi:hypothetical protein A3Q56_03983 [Intoshia linei]|uniref:USP domain-containing protein n=1 Tax=Intoshia linei TaxID=1819745 RepID=A0A177B1X4_9BILA|nr:hypothetical protein A3Q56_03983 [Intoshia linei]